MKLLNLREWDTPPRHDVPELIDDATQPYADFRASMTDVRRANLFLGGTAVVTRQARRWLRQASRNPAPVSPVTFLDVATGSGDIPEAIARAARQIGVPVRILGLDYSAPILRFAGEQVGGRAEIRLLRGDAFHLPFADDSFDYALCSLAFHHFAFADCVTAIREMERVSRRGWLVNDVRRARSAWLLIRTITRLIGANRLTQHDAPASVLRAWTPEEFQQMAQAGALQGGRVILRRSLFYRMALIGESAKQ